MKVAVVSDTHLPRFGRRLPNALVRAFADAGIDRILHLGDWTSTLAVDLLEEIAPVDGVAGNNDPPELVERFGRRKVIEIAGVRIGLTHGDLGDGRTTPERARRTFEASSPGASWETTAPPRVILFGHSHVPLLEWLPDGRLLLNPGSPTDKRREPRYSWALLDVLNGEVRAELEFFDS